MDDVASDEVLGLAFQWLCERRKGYPDGDEVVNDDPNEQNESTALDQFDQFFVFDAPSIVNPQMLEYHLLHNMRDFLRINVEGSRPAAAGGVEPPQGSRASAKYLWHSTINLETINGVLTREPIIANKIGPGNIIP